MATPATDFDPYAAAVLADSFAHPEFLRELGPVFEHNRHGCYGMPQFADVRCALDEWETFVSSRGVGPSGFAREERWRPPLLLLEADPPLHWRTCGLMNKVVALPGLKARLPERKAKAARLDSGLVGTGPFDAVPALSEAFSLSVFPDLIGLSKQGREDMLPYAMPSFKASVSRNTLLEESLASAVEAAALRSRPIPRLPKRRSRKVFGGGQVGKAPALQGRLAQSEATNFALVKTKSQSMGVIKCQFGKF